MKQVKFKILIVDDDEDIVELLTYNLVKGGYAVSSASDGRAAIAVAQEVIPDLILMDVMMPNLDGIEAARILRTMPVFKNTYILFLTARSEEHSEVAAFELGADDYINKPIKPAALMSRIGAFFRRDSQKNVIEDHLNIAGLSINRDTYSVTKPDGTIIVLPRKEFELLAFLSQHPNKVFGREDLLLKVWGRDVYVMERTIDVHIRKVREKIGENFIKTLKGVGYMFVDE
jgi:two-component system, OmpR family, alkaline phosphatase synthesis response regulator PhoP